MDVAPARQVDEDLAASTAACIPEEPAAPSVAPSLTYSTDSEADEGEELLVDQQGQPQRRQRRASTMLVAQNVDDVRRITGESTAQVLRRCCGGGCCLSTAAPRDNAVLETVVPPDNDAFRSLQIRIDENRIPTRLTGVTDLPEQTAFFESPSVNSYSFSSSASAVLPSPVDSAICVDLDQEFDRHLDQRRLGQGFAGHELSSSPSPNTKPESVDTAVQPPSFVQPHPPYHLFLARIHNARELTRPGAEKRTFHLDLDVTDYPTESDVDFKVGGAIGVSAANDAAVVDRVLDLLMMPRPARDRPVMLRTTRGRWPTVWGPDAPRRLTTTRRDLLTWCSDIQSYAPTKPLLRVLAEHAEDESERKLLTYLCSAEGQGAFCDLRTGPHVSLVQLLSAFPSCRPPLDVLLSALPQLMPRFYSLSNDPHEESQELPAATAPSESSESPESSKSSESVPGVTDGQQSASHLSCRRRLVEIAVTVHETADWQGGCRTGVGSGFLERQALRFLRERERERERGDGTTGTDTGGGPDVYVPMFRGLMANPLAREFVSDGPMLLVGAGVGIAPFRGFVQRRLKSANCANKVWVLQGIRDSLVDEIYNGEWGVHEDKVKRVVQSRRGEGRYVQEEVRNQADLVWYIVNAVDGRVFVCGSTKGMGEGVEQALVDVAMRKGNLDREEAEEFWRLKKEAGQYIAETW